MLKFSDHEVSSLITQGDTMSSNNILLYKTRCFTPLPGQESKGRWRNRNKRPHITGIDVKNFLIQNPDVFESYVMESIPVDILQRLIEAKQDKPEKGIHLECATIPLQPRYAQDSVKEISSQLVDIVENHEINTQLSEMVLILARAVNGSHTTVYIPTHHNHELCILRNGKLVPYGPSGIGTTVAAHVIIKKKTILVEDIEFDSR
jgi:hypothetical protein